MKFSRIDYDLLSLKYIIAWFIIAIVFLVAVYYGTGYFHPDEHYQLIEFARFKMGLIDSSNLAWEYDAQIRPSVQVWICLLIFRMLNYFGVYDPYALSFFLRLFTALLALLSIWFFYKRSKNYLAKKYHYYYFLSSYFLWFIPIVSVRFSSETWSGVIFIFALALCLRVQHSWKSSLTVGLLLALSFLFRFQTGILSFALVCYLVFFGMFQFRLIIPMAIGFLAVLQVGILMDSIFYGNYVLTFFNYFKVNILHDVASQFGVSPWTTIIKYITVYPTLPIGIPIFIAYIFILIRKPLNPFTFVSLPFIFIHALIPHKELRFLFPIIWLIPIILMLAIQEMENSFHFIRSYCLPAVWLMMGGTLLLWNVVLLILGVNQPIGYGEKRITQAIDEKYRGLPIHFIYTENANPYQPWINLRESFYERSPIHFDPILSFRELGIQKYTFSSDTVYLLSTRDPALLYFQLKTFDTSLLVSEVDVIYSSFVYKLIRKYYVGFERYKPYSIYTIKPHKK